MKRLLLALACLCASLQAQTTHTFGALNVNNTWTANQTFTGIFNASTATHTLPFKAGLTASLPATCTVGEKYFATDATAGQNDYSCTATNTWTQDSGGGSGSGTVSANNTGNANACVQYASNGGSTTVQPAANPCGSGGSVSGQASGVIPLGTTATSITQQSHCDDGVTTAATVTCTEPIASNTFKISGHTLSGVVGNSANVQLAGTVAGVGATLCTDANQNSTTSGCASGGTGNAAQTHSVAFSATPTFTATSATAGTVDTFVFGAMTANVTSSTATGFTNGQLLNFQITQDATGGRTFAWPAGFTGATCTVDPVASVTTYASYYVDASGVPQLISCNNNETASISRFGAERAAPTTCTGAGCEWPDSTDHDLEFKNSSGSLFKQFLAGQDCNPVTGICTKTSGTPFGPYATATTITRECGDGLGDGLNAIPAGTYSVTNCFNDLGATYTITAIRCFTDNNGTSTLNAANDGATGLLTGAVTCTNSWAAGTQSATTTIATSHWINFTFVADGTSKKMTLEVTLTR